MNQLTRTFDDADENGKARLAETKAILDSSETWADFCEHQTHFKARETLRLNAVMEKLEPAAARIVLDHLLRPALDQTEAVAFEKHALGVWFTVNSVLRLLKEDKEKEVRVDGKYHVANPDGIQFEGLIAGEDGKPTPIHRRIVIDDVFTIMRGDKAFIYKSKYHPARQFGAIEKLTKGGREEIRNAYNDHNLLLKYQAAIQHGLIAGAAVEVRGRIDSKFLAWACGHDAFNSGAIPDVQIICNVMLPSGADYRFTLKKAADRDKELLVENDDTAYTAEDRLVIRGLELAQETYEIYKLMSGEDLIEKDDAAGSFNETGSVTYEDIKDPNDFMEYTRLAREGLWRRAKEIKPGKYNLNENTIFSAQNIGIENRPEDLGKIIDWYQLYLVAHPHIARTKASYSLGEPGTSEYAHMRARAIEVYAKNIAYIRSKEEERLHSKDYPELCAQRVSMRWEGPKEGIGLGMDHIMYDSIIELMATTSEEKKGRSYENSETRFMNIDAVLNHLEQEKDRVVVQIQYHDPLNIVPGEKKASTWYNNASDYKLVRLESDALRANVRRGLKYIDEHYGPNAPKRKGDNQRKMYERRKDEIAELRKKFEDAKLMAGRLDKELKAARRAEGLRELPADHPVTLRQEANIELMRETEKQLGAQIDQVFDEGTKRKMFVQVFAQRQNLMKFIYAVRSDNTAVYDEESRNYTGTRASHSELIGGEFGYGAGEIVFQRNERENRWEMKEINNGSGHYRPPTQTLKFASNVILGELNDYYQRLGMDASSAEDAVKKVAGRCRLYDSIARGRDLRDAEIAGFRLDTKSSPAPVETRAPKLSERLGAVATI